MPYFGRTSKRRLETCHPDLQKVFNEVIKHFDCSIICGHRGEDEQDNLYFDIPPKTQVQFPNSKHNKLPSYAVDAAPYIDGKICWEPAQLYYFAGFVRGIALGMGIDLRLGADWDSDGDIKDQTFFDRPHFEIKE